MDRPGRLQELADAFGAKDLKKDLTRPSRNWRGLVGIPDAGRRCGRRLLMHSAIGAAATASSICPKEFCRGSLQ
jgi:hypothetical protein